MWIQQDNNDWYMESRQLSLEILKSIRDCDIRLDELQNLIKNNDNLQIERRQTLIKRVESLIATRFSLMYSFMDLNGSKRYVLSNTKDEDLNPFNHLGADYNLLKRNRSTTGHVPIVKK